MKKITVVFFWCVFALFVFIKHGNKVANYINPTIKPQEIETPAAPNKSEEFNEMQKELLSLHNKERTSKGYAPLALDNKLCDYAQTYAEKMAKSNSMTHSSMSKLQEVNKDSGFVGENIAWGQEDAASVVEAWMWSPGHRWNILGSKYKRVGFGTKEDKDGKNYWCTVFSD